MTDEEYARAVQQFNSLQNEYNHLVRRVQELANELDYSIDATISAINNAKLLSSIVLPNLDYQIQESTEVNISTKQIYQAIVDLKEKYFTIKNVSTASKKLTELDDLYEKKFRFYNQLRKITLGYVIGIDKNIISNETLRTSVEKQQLLNSDYWVSYALSGIMLWINDNQEASIRSVTKALELDEYKSALFFMLVNLRFGRADAARKWYAIFSKDTDIFNIGNEWEFILQAYLNHAFGNDKVFEEQVRLEFNRLLNEMKNSYANFKNKIINKTIAYATSYPYLTNNTYTLLQENCNNYHDLIHLLTLAQKNVELAKYYLHILEKDNDINEKLTEEIENILYNLISAYDKEEYEIIKQVKLNEYIIRAQGDLASANQMYKTQIEEYEQNKTLFDLMTKFAFADINSNIDNKTRKFSISFMLDSIKEGYLRYNEELLTRLDDKYEFDINGCVFKGNDKTIDESRNIILKHFKKNRLKFLLKDKKVKTFLVLGIVFAILIAILTSLLITKILQFTIPVIVFFVIFVIGTITFWTLFGLMANKRTMKIKQQKMESLKKLQDVNQEFIHYKNDLKASLDENKLLQDTLDKFE